jgi:hypothetical protein
MQAGYELYVGRILLACATQHQTMLQRARAGRVFCQSAKRLPVGVFGAMYSETAK